MDQKSSKIAPPPDDLDILLQEGWAEFCAQDFHNVTLPAAACVTQTLNSENPALQPPSTVAESGPEWEEEAEEEEDQAPRWTQITGG